MYVILHTRIRQLPGPGRVVTTGYPDPVPGEIPYPSHLYTKRLSGLRSLTYDERCARLVINRLELRRLHVDLTLCYKIIHGLVLSSCDRFFTIVYDHTTRGHSLKLFVPSSRVNCRQHFFAVRILICGTHHLKTSSQQNN